MSEDGYLNRILFILVGFIIPNMPNHTRKKAFPKMLNKYHLQKSALQGRRT